MEFVGDAISIDQVHRLKLDRTEIVDTGVVSHFAVEAGGAQ